LLNRFAPALPNGASVVAALLARNTAPVFDGGAGRARVQDRQAQLEQAGAAHAGIVLGAPSLRLGDGDGGSEARP
jgi:outer membrane protein TolC